MSDLWPKDIGNTNLRAPVSILREQASLLGEKTQNLVKADVYTLRSCAKTTWNSVQLFFRSGF